NAIAASGRMPSKLVLTSMNAAGGVTETTLTFTDVKHIKMAYPLPAGLTAQLRLEAKTSATARDKALAKIVEVLDGKAPPKPSRETLLNGIEKAADPIDGFFLFLNYSQQYGADLNGPEGAAIQARIGPPLRRFATDQTVQRFLDVNRL